MDLKHKIMAQWKLLFSVSATLVLVGTSYTAFASSTNTSAAYVDKSLKPAKSCESLEGTRIADTTDNVSFTVDSAVADSGNSDMPASCRVTVSATHPPAGDDVTIWVWLPSNGWNGRFQGTGGSGYLGGSQASLTQPLKEGYAVAATDTGHTVNGASYALNEDGTLNWQLIEDNVVGVHEMTVAGKALTKAYYGKDARYAYFTGCSTGGRQGLTEAARYPEDYDGILGGSPAINVVKQRMAGMWGQLVMKEANNFVPGCKFDAATAAAIKACDGMDRVKDGVVTDPLRCKYDPRALIGTTTDCGVVTKADAEVIAKIWDGARDSQGNFMWYGQARSSSLTSLNGTTMVNGQLDGTPSAFNTEWIKYFLTQRPDWDWHALTLPRFEQLFTQSVQQYSGVLGDNPDLNAFRKAGGKVLLWQGQSDPLLSQQSTTSYYDQVVEKAGGLHKAQDFARLYLAPGVGHCGGGVGAQPVGQLDALKKWVEQGKAPSTLQAQKTDSNGAVTQTRPLCAYPEMAVYRGVGDTNKASSFTCKRQ